MNPLAKTILTTLGGAVVGSAVAAFDHPTGGFAATLAAHPDIAVAYVLADKLLHNLFSRWFPA